MTIPRVNALVTYWSERCPPASKSLAAFIGFKPAAKTDEAGEVVKSEEARKKEEENVFALMQMFPNKAPPPLPFKPPVKQNV